MKMLTSFKSNKIVIIFYVWVRIYTMLELSFNLKFVNGLTFHHIFMLSNLLGKSYLQTLPNTPFSSNSWFFPLLRRAGRTSPTWNLLQSYEEKESKTILPTIIHQLMCYACTYNQSKQTPFTHIKGQQNETLHVSKKVWFCLGHGYFLWVIDLYIS